MSQYRPFGTGPHIDRAGVSTRVRISKPVSLQPTFDKNSLAFDVPAIRARALAVRSRAPHKDLDGPTAQQIAGDVLSLLEALGFSS